MFLLFLSHPLSFRSNEVLSLSRGYLMPYGYYVLHALGKKLEPYQQPHILNVAFERVQMFAIYHRWPPSGGALNIARPLNLFRSCGIDVAKTETAFNAMELVVPKFGAIDETLTLNATSCVCQQQRLLILFIDKRLTSPHIICRYLFCSVKD